jgi:hypothetical protein
LPLQCNINKRGRVGRLILGALLLITSLPTIYLQGPVGWAGILALGAGLFTLWEAAAGWCILVAALERWKAGITRKRLIRAILGAST